MSLDLTPSKNGTMSGARGKVGFAFDNSWVEYSQDASINPLPASNAPAGTRNTISIKSQLVKDKEHDGETPMLTKITYIQIGNALLTLRDKFEFALRPDNTEAISTSSSHSCHNRLTQPLLPAPEPQVKTEEVGRDISAIIADAFDSHSDTRMESEHENMHDMETQSVSTRASDKSYTPLWQPHRSIRKRSENFEKRDRKNVVKNYIKAFRSMVNNPVDESEVSRLTGITDRGELDAMRHRFEAFIRARNFNNQLIVDLIKSEFSAVFIHFLEDRAGEWLKNSKVNDKLAHEEALDQYIKAAHDDRELCKMRVLKYRKPIRKRGMSFY